MVYAASLRTDLDSL